MKSTKHEAKRTEILESAFRIWGECRYQSTSLADIAAAHDITKQAIYRYFSSKEKLETAMEERALGIYDAHCAELAAAMEELSGEDLVARYVQDSIEFITRSGRYLGFLSYRYRQSSAEPVHARSHAERFARIARKNADVPGVGLRYLNALVFQEVHRRSTRRNSAGGWEEAWNEGFGSPRIDGPPDFDRVLADAATVDYASFGEDPLMRAVFDTVMEEAGNTVSLGKVARRAGLTKSSLYNYWPSKEAMLTDVLGRQMDLYGEMFADFADRYSRPGDQLFAYLAFLGTFLRRTPEILNYLQRMMSAGVAMPMQHRFLDEGYGRALTRVVDSGFLDLKGYEPVGFLGLVNLASVNEVKHHLSDNTDRLRTEQGLKDLYRLILGGIPALRRTM